MHTVENVQSAIDYVEEQLAEQLSLEEISRAAAMSVPNLYRLFYAMTGHPIKEYIRKRRTSEAACLLRQTNLPSIEIGFRCGFDTNQTFIKTFKRNTGLTPGLYRKAEVIYSFERIRLHERFSYLEEREISERYPDVKVISLSPQKGIGYLHVADREERLEEEAYIQFQSILSESNIDSSQMRLFGWNVDLEGSKPSFGYQMMAVSPEKKVRFVEHTDLQPIELSGGTYAITWTPMDSSPKIVNAWNRLLSEWLPLSTFELGGHGFLEEYQQFNGRISRLKLYLPVRRSQEKETIEILVLKPLRVMRFRAEGVNCVSRADEAAIKWLTRNGFIGDNRLKVFMSSSYGSPSDDSSMYEICITLLEGFVPSREEEHRVTYMEGGLYACLTTRSLGSMDGVLERIYRWLGTSYEYEADEERSWFTHYILDESVEEWEAGSLEKLVSVKCCVPIVLRNLKQGD
ncbi:helix-turn-helix domain-containing protein [Paenibacillus chibensis]|uniref:helix-turn-helix domain-containing protein n=1 Tax=Paenibacillus chibensis TaxID=59846 RepID=UPI000FD7B994|nr:helix-turn-helix domain-containing protein [Paenibacillus chibensis]MEC0371143.1 helix-turn-helix domain-containing protein [Paenibacillus chibensis]